MSVTGKIKEAAGFVKAVKATNGVVATLTGNERCTDLHCP